MHHTYYCCFIFYHHCCKIGYSSNEIFVTQVRYESRKKLAEQRPRIKGQFVRQVLNDPSPTEIDGNAYDD